MKPVHEGLLVELVSAGGAPHPGPDAVRHPHQVLDVQGGFHAGLRDVVGANDLGATSIE